MFNQLTQSNLYCWLDCGSFHLSIVEEQMLWNVWSTTVVDFHSEQRVQDVVVKPTNYMKPSTFSSPSLKAYEI